MFRIKQMWNIWLPLEYRDFAAPSGKVLEKKKNHYLHTVFIPLCSLMFVVIMALFID